MMPNALLAYKKRQIKSRFLSRYKRQISSDSPVLPDLLLKAILRQNTFHDSTKNETIPWKAQFLLSMSLYYFLKLPVKFHEMNFENSNKKQPHTKRPIRKQRLIFCRNSLFNNRLWFVRWCLYICPLLSGSAFYKVCGQSLYYSWFLCFNIWYAIIPAMVFHL